MIRLLKLIAEKLSEVIASIIEYEYEDILDREWNKE